MNVYCDHNATTPLRPEALEAMLPWLRDEFANPSSSHAAGSRARCAIEAARVDVAELLGCDAAEVVFTSGGTESNDAALRGVVRALDPGRPSRIVSTAIEHASVLATLHDIEGATAAASVEWVALDAEGRVETHSLAEALSRAASLVSVGWANNEIGVVQPMAEIAALCRRACVPLHSDAVQAVGKITVDVTDVDLASMSAHKIGGPKGVGALFVRSGTPWRPVLLGGAQERERRAGTENVAGIVGFGHAARLCRFRREGEASRLRRLRDDLWERLRPLAGVHRHGPTTSDGLPNTLNLRFDDVRGEALVAALDIEGIAVSSGSACAAGAAEPSHVLEAIGVEREAARDGVRFSFGAASADGDPATIAQATAEAVARIRAVRRTPAADARRAVA